ncbi:MAG: tetratricopeptide repeat protein, partial [Thermosynechococcaceae cyanobacterium]
YVLCNLYYSQCRYTEAKPLYGQSLQIAEDKLGLTHPTTVLVHQNLANLYDKMIAQFKLLGR